MKKWAVLLFTLGLSNIAAFSCSDESPEAGAPPAPVPPTSVDAAPIEKDANTSEPKTEIVFAIDGAEIVQFGYTLEVLTLEVRINGLVVSNEDVDLAKEPSPIAHETRVVAPADRTDAKVELLMVASSQEIGVKYTRRATTRFVRGRSLLAYITIDPSCAVYDSSSPLLCTNPGETCRSGACRSDALSANLPDYRSDWASNPPPACGGGPTGSIVLGRGEKTNTPIVDNETVPVDCGPQGGHHVWLALSLRDLSRTNVTTTISGTQPSSAGGETVVPTSIVRSFDEVAEGDCQLVGLQFQLDLGGKKIQTFLGKPLDVKVDVTDKTGRTATASRHLNIASAYAGPFCQPDPTDAGSDAEAGL